MTDLLTKTFTETLEQAVDSVVAIDAENNIILFNQAAEKLWGYTKTEVLGKNIKLLIPDNIKPMHDRFVNENRLGGHNKIIGGTIEVPILTKNGVQKWGEISISKADCNDMVLYTAFIKDVTQSVLSRKHLELLSLVTDKTDNAIAIINNHWETIYINPGFSALFGYSEQELLGHSPIAILAPHLTADNRELIRQSHLAGKAIKQDQILQTKTNERLWCSIMSNPILDEQGQFVNAVIIASEITNTKLHEILNQRILGALANEQPLSEIMAYACDEISKLSDDIVPAILKCEGQYLHLLAAPKMHSAYQQHLAKFKIIDGVGSSATAAHRGEAVLVSDIANDPLWPNFRDKILPLGYTGCLSVPVKNSNNQVVGIVNFYYKNNKTPTDLHDTFLNILVPICALVFEREKQREDIKTLAYYDTLTKLPNRNLLYANAQQALQEAEASKTKLAFLFLDVDRFKIINDTLGHPTGDQLLANIAARLPTKTHQLHITGRLSGDEFIVITPFTDNDHLNEFVEDLRLRIAAPLIINDHRMTPSVSIGISIYPDDGADIETLFHRSDMAMYQAKSAGKGRFSYFSHDLNQLAEELQTIEIELEKAINNNQLRLHYQPQVSMLDNTVYGVEALARWSHPELGIIEPSKFIPIAEECGLIGDLSKWAIHQACKQMSAWREKGIYIPTISVNLSPINFHNNNLCEQIISELEHFNLQTSDLILELTESVLLDTNPSTMEMLLKIHATGINFSMDDFGTGYSSLNYLQKIPIKELKLDRSFVQDLETNQTNQALSKAVLQIGKSLNINVVAEGIEKTAQSAILKQQGYHLAQGYLFSKPLNSQQVEAWLTAFNATGSTL